MKKIEEMADAYGRENPFTWYDADGEINENTSLPAIAYSDGANAVLKEIEPLVTTLRSGARKLFEEKIKELKGE